MQLIAKKRDFTIILRLQRGEELFEELERFVRKYKIKGVWFWALGASDAVELAYYSLKKKQYIRKKFKGELEIIGITGNVAFKEGKVIVHAHGAFSQPDYSTISGHIFSCHISGTCEIALQKFPPLKRKHDSDTGLNLLAR